MASQSSTVLSPGVRPPRLDDWHTNDGARPAAWPRLTVDYRSLSRARPSDPKLSFDRILPLRPWVTSSTRQRLAARLAALIAVRCVRWFDNVRPPCVTVHWQTRIVLTCTSRRLVMMSSRLVAETRHAALVPLGASGAAAEVAGWGAAAGSAAASGVATLRFPRAGYPRALAKDLDAKTFRVPVVFPKRSMLPARHRKRPIQ